MVIVQALAVLADLADVATIIAAVVAVVALAAVWKQLQGAADAARAQATIAFQAAFAGSADARARVQAGFPVHTSAPEAVLPLDERGQVAMWTDLRDLTPGQKRDAATVINALNDVAQYVADGLPVRSALQQYHTIFVRVGFLLAPYIEQTNAPRDDGKPPARLGVRVIDLYNAGIGYHLTNPKHRGRALSLTRGTEDGAGVTLRLLDDRGRGVIRVPAFRADGTRAPVGPDPSAVKEVVAGLEAELRPERRWYEF